LIKPLDLDELHHVELAWNQSIFAGSIGTASCLSSRDLLHATEGMHGHVAGPDICGLEASVSVPLAKFRLDPEHDWDLAHEVRLPNFSSMHSRRKGTAELLPDSIQRIIPEAGGPKLICVHDRKFESYAVAFRWEHPKQYIIEASLLAAADAAPE